MLTGLSSFDNEAVQVRLTITILPACRVRLLEHALAFAIEDQMSPELSSTWCWTRLDLQRPSHRRKTLNVVLKPCMVLDDKILAFVAESIKICPDTKLAQWTACVWMAKRCWNQIWNLMCWNTRTNVTTCHTSPWAQNSSLQNKQHDNDPTLRIQPHLSPNCANQMTSMSHTKKQQIIISSTSKRPSEEREPKWQMPQKNKIVKTPTNMW